MMRSYRIHFAVAVAALLVSCGGKGAQHPHDDHDHEGHDHAAEMAEGHSDTTDGHILDEDNVGGRWHDENNVVHYVGDGHDHSGIPVGMFGEHDHESEITLHDEQSEALGVTYEKLSPSPFSEIIRTGGELESNTSARSTVVATAAGIVSFGGRKLAEGMSIRKGELLVTLSSDQLADNNYPQRLADARAALDKAQADYSRAQSLSGDRIVSAEELDAAKLAFTLAQQQYNALSRNATRTGRNIIAPQSGYITSLLVREGDYVEAGQAMAAISTNTNLVLRADVPQRYLPYIGSVVSASFTTPYDGVNHDLSRLHGRLMGAGRAVSQNSSTLPVRFEFDNQGGLVEGMIVEVFLKGTPQDSVLTVPLTALTEEQGSYYVYLRVHPERYLKRLVTLGRSDGRRVEVLRGLAPGYEIVSSGAYYIRLAALTAGGVPDGHQH